jgi:phosphoribosylformimino-5-aminoimidazole carboxamide ribonucleotide (ProFAR) isomerase
MEGRYLSLERLLPPRSSKKSRTSSSSTTTSRSYQQNYTPHADLSQLDGHSDEENEENAIIESIVSSTNGKILFNVPLYGYMKRYRGGR